MRLVKGFLLAATISVACSDPIGPRGNLLGGRSWPPAVVLTNLSGSPVYYFAVEATTATVISWAPCVDPERCGSVPAHGSRSLTPEEIPGYFKGGTALIHHYRLVPERPGSARFRPDSIRSLGIPLIH
jgi:hypothetical protein